MIGWYTDNEISQTVMAAIEKCGHDTLHVKYFNPMFFNNYDLIREQIFYGILRGTGAAMRRCQSSNHPYYYIDNGYFGAEYIDATGQKDMGGKYRIVKNDMVEQYTGSVISSAPKEGNIFLLIPPSPYTANFYDTTPEDWLQHWSSVLLARGYKLRIRGNKSAPLSHDLDVIRTEGAGVLAFNSMALMPALQQGIPVYDTHGLFRNADAIKGDNFVPCVMYDFNEVKAFYEPKQFTLEEISQGKACL